MAKVDVSDFNALNADSWCAGFSFSKKEGCYATRAVMIDGKHVILKMHRIITGAPKGKVVDHINGDTLDNRRSNLRVCTHRENLLNVTLNASNTTGYLGVSKCKRSERYETYITVNGKRKFLGYYDDPVTAAKARDVASILYFGEFAKLNFPRD